MSAVRTPAGRGLRRLGQVRVPRLLRGGPGSRPRRLHLLVALAGLLLVLGCGWLWLRSSSLVAVRSVTITGVSGPDAPQIRQALAARARRMTTLNASSGELHAAVAVYPEVRAVQVSTSFPHGISIHVVENDPVGTVRAGARTVVVDQAGQLLPDAPINARLPAIEVPARPGQQSLASGDGAQAVALLAAAPYPILTRLAWVRVAGGEGLVAGLRSGPQLVFGDPTQLGLKWAAADAVLADGSAAGASYVDVTDPARPAAGSGQDRGVTTLPAPAGATAGTAAPATAGTPAPTSAAAPSTSTGG